MNGRAKYTQIECYGQKKLFCCGVQTARYVLSEAWLFRISGRSGRCCCVQGRRYHTSWVGHVPHFLRRGDKKLTSNLHTAHYFELIETTERLHEELEKIITTDKIWNWSITSHLLECNVIRHRHPHYDVELTHVAKARLPSQQLCCLSLTS